MSSRTSALWIHEREDEDESEIGEEVESAGYLGFERSLVGSGWI